MNHAFMQKAMWVAFKGSFCESLRSVLAVDNPSDIMKRSKTRYAEILSKLPDFAKDDTFYINILSGSAFAAIMLELPKRPTIQDATQFYEQAMVSNLFMRIAAKQEDYYTKRGREKLKYRAAKSESWFASNPYTWIFTVKDGQTLNQYTAEFTQCGICRLMNELGLSELTPALCHYDYPMNALNHTEFTREYTLASGGPMCDCHYNHKESKAI